MRTLILLSLVGMIGCSDVSDSGVVSQNLEHVDERVPNIEADSDSKGNDMREDLIEFLQEPNRETYLTFRAKIIASDNYSPYSNEFDTATELCEQERIEDARETLQDAMGNLMLSPRAHHLLGFLHHKLENERAAEMELMIGDACLQGILATGDGSKDAPYIVVRTSDEHDIISHLEKQFKQQSLTHVDEKHFDLIQ